MKKYEFVVSLKVRVKAPTKAQAKVYVDAMLPDLRRVPETFGYDEIKIMRPKVQS